MRTTTFVPGSPTNSTFKNLKISAFWEIHTKKKENKIEHVSLNIQFHFMLPVVFTTCPWEYEFNLITKLKVLAPVSHGSTIYFPFTFDNNNNKKIS